MTDEQWWGIVLIALGIYFVTCAAWQREFVLYRLKAARMSAWFGEEVADIFFGLLGAVMIILGIVKALGYF